MVNIESEKPGRLTGLTSTADICRAVAKDLKQRGYTQAQAAELMRISPKAEANQISGKRAFGKKAARLYSHYFGYSEPFLLHGEGSLTGETKTNTMVAKKAIILTEEQYEQLIHRISTLEKTVAGFTPSTIESQPVIAIVPQKSPRKVPHKNHKRPLHNKRHKNKYLVSENLSTREFDCAIDKFDD